LARDQINKTLQVFRPDGGAARLAGHVRENLSVRMTALTEATAAAAAAGVATSSANMPYGWLGASPTQERQHLTP